MASFLVETVVYFQRVLTLSGRSYLNAFVTEKECSPSLFSRLLPSAPSVRITFARSVDRRSRICSAARLSTEGLLAVYTNNGPLNVTFSYVFWIKEKNKLYVVNSILPFMFFDV